MAEENDSIPQNDLEDDLLDTRFADPYFGAVHISVYRELIAAGKNKTQILCFIKHLYDCAVFTYRINRHPRRLLSGIKLALQHERYTECDSYADS